MKKTFIFVAVLLLLFSPTQCFAEGAKEIRFESSKEQFLANNKTLKKLANIEKQVELKYKDEYDEAQKIETDGITLNIRGKSFFVAFNNQQKMQLYMKKEFVPEQIKYQWTMTSYNKEVVKNSLVIGLRGLYLGALNSTYDVNFKNEQISAFDTKANQNKARYELGYITLADYNLSLNSLNAAKSDFVISKRTKENSIRSFNYLAGVSVASAEDTFVAGEKFDISDLMPVEDYINKAIIERVEILSLQKQIELQKFQISILERNDVYKNYEDQKKQYENANKNLQILNLKLEKARYEIEQEIKNAYVDIRKEADNIQSLKISLDQMKLNYEQLKQKCEHGFILPSVLDDLTLGINKLSNGINMEIFTCNTKLIKLGYAASIGPAYQ